MARYLKHINQAENKLTVGALEVLGDVTGSGFKTIKKTIDSLSGSVATINTKITDYWSDIADDKIITPAEKKTLKKEWNTIEQTYAAILEAAEDEGLSQAAEITAYIAQYQSLYAYINSIKVFDAMGDNTEIDDVDEFNSQFATYYAKELAAQNRLAAGLASATVRVLQNLYVTGIDGEVAIYNGNFYKFSLAENKWNMIDTSTVYLGALNAEPQNAVAGSFFLAKADILYPMRLSVNGGSLLTVNDGSLLTVNGLMSEGNVYVRNDKGWSVISNHNDWRYMVALNDVIKYGYTVPDEIEDFIQVKAHTAAYLGAIRDVEAPQSPVQGYIYINFVTLKKFYYNGLQWEETDIIDKDYFMWAGTNETEVGDLTLLKGYVYKYINGEWQELVPEESVIIDGVSYLKNADEFMAALGDILKTRNAGAGYFSSVFASAFFANNAAIESLQTKTITLTGNNAVIKSNGFTSGAETGFILRSDGTFELQGGTIRDASIISRFTIPVYTQETVPQVIREGEMFLLK